jgi:large subunit ribosomal protein L14
MLQLRSIVNVADNSGAKKVMFIGMPKKGRKKIGGISEMMTGVVKDALPFGQVKKGEVVYAVIVRTRKEKRRADGSYIRFDDNACVLLQGKDNKEPRGTRIFGPIAKEIKDAGYNKIASLAEEIY